MKPRLLFISRKWPPAVGGMETHAVELAETLGEAFDVTLLVLPGKSNGQPPSLLGYGLFLVKAVFYCLMHGRRFEHVVLEDLLLFPAAVCCRLVRKRQRRVVVVHGLDLVYGTRRGILSRLYRSYFAGFRACQRIFCAIATHSSYGATLAENCGLTNVHVIQPALPASSLAAVRSTPGDLPAAFVRAPRRILQFGRLVPRKGALWFARYVLPAIPADVQLFIVGPPTDRQYAEALARCDRTVYLGVVPAARLAAMIRVADVVVMPNIPSPPGQQDVEGFGLVAIETAALGGVLLASRWQGMTDAVIDGVTGVLVNPGDAGVWQQAVQTLLGESPAQREERRTVARAQAGIRFARQRVADAYGRLLASPASGDGALKPQS